MFEMGDLDNLKAEDLKNFILKRANEKWLNWDMNQLMHYDEKSAAELDWFYHLTGGHTHTISLQLDQLIMSKAGEDENWDEDDF